MKRKLITVSRRNTVAVLIDSRVHYSQTFLKKQPLANSFMLNNLDLLETEGKYPVVFKYA